ncbi:MAG TPA: amino acid adenylation domain-containing protein, partial [Pyrinomonadaceae bacterium]|nr:amino acid adenylation domain-containing protein [Pyrinomonadaceae bacterium]
TDITVGTPVANRRRAELEPLIGFFANTLVLRLDTSDCASFRDVVKRARAVCLGAYAHQDLPFEKLVEELRPERSLSHTPLFQTLFVLQNVPRAEFRLEELRLEGLSTELGAVKFDLTLVAEESSRGLAYTFEYNTDLFAAETIERMSSHFARLLQAIVAAPEQGLSELKLLTDEERRQLLYDWNDTAKQYQHDKCIHELIREQVERSPDAVALVFEDEQLTYKQLNERANQVAHYLHKRGVQPDQPVAIMMERSIEMVVSLLGTMKAGAAYLPLDPQYPQERLDFMLKDAGAPVLLTQDPVVWETIARESTDEPNTKITPNNLAYVIYTSGSTGQPKGVMIPHRGISNRLQWMQDAYQLNEFDAVVQKTSYSFDVSVWEFFWPLMTGARLVIARPGGHQDPAYLVELISQQKITTLHFVPPMLKLFLEEQQVDRCTSLRRVICSGEALTNELATLFFNRLPHAELHNLYGPTEASVDVSFWQCQPHTARRSVPIGRPIANAQLYILDSSGEPTPIGIAGELHIGGIGLARGYLNRPALTAERFIPDSFSNAGARLYKTGDLARFWPDGNIEFLGRLDHQVKVRGFRIELSEIEAVLAAHSAVQNAIVLAREDEPGEKRLVAYVVARNVTEIELRSHLRERLPEYMIPAVFMLLPELPLTTNGKIDRRALPAPGTTRPGSDESYIAPRTEVEELLTSIWADVLNLERVGVADNFFALGGDSIRSVRLLAKARERGLEFSLQQLFRHQTIGDLAREIAFNEIRSSPLPSTKPFELISDDDRSRLPADVVDAYPLTMMQGGMLFHMALTPETAVYHNVNSWHLRAQFDRERFQKAVNHVVARHPILRTYFDLTSYSEPLQLVQESVMLHVGVTDLRPHTDEEQGALLDQFVAFERSRGFDISRPPLLRFHVHLRTAETFQFTLTESHPIFDGWSLNSTLAEIFCDYFTLLKGQTLPPVSPVSVTFRDFVQMEQQTLASAECRNFWDEKLRDLNVTRLPRLPAPYRQPGAQRIREEYAVISAEVSKQLHAIARSLKVPIKSVLLTAHQKVLGLLSGETDVVTGLLMNGRPEALDGEEVRGMFLNTVPFRLRLSKGTWSDLIRTTFESEWELLPYRRYPLLAMQRQTGLQPLFEAQFNFVHFHVLENVLRSGDVEVLRDVKKRMFEEAHFLLTANFGLSVFSEQVNLMLQYDSTELSADQVRAIAGYYVETLERIARDPSEDHNARTPIPTAERQRLLIEWNETAQSFSHDRCLHELIEIQVDRTPESVAVVSDDVSLSYRDLNERANRLAHFLQSRGVGPDTSVAILLERSVEMLVGLLAILKAGGAYVPLDPDYPEERLRFMLEDCNATVLLTTKQMVLPKCSQATVIYLDP